MGHDQANNALLALGVEDYVIRAGILAQAVSQVGTPVTSFTLGGDTYTGFTVTAISVFDSGTQFTVTA